MHGARRLQEIEPLRRFRKRNAANVMQAAGLTGDFLEFPVKADGVTLQGCHVGIGIQRVEATRGMPGRTRGQFRALDQHHVLHTEPGQVIDDAAADNPAADNHYLRMRIHINDPQSLTCAISKRSIQHVENYGYRFC